MKKGNYIIIAFFLSFFLFSGCVASDPVTDDLYLTAVYASQIGSPTNNVTVGYFHELFVDNETLYIGGIPITELIVGGGASSGNITRPIAQSDVANLITDLAGKEPTTAAGNTSQYLRGDKTWQNLPAGGGGDMDKATYDPDANGVIALAQLDPSIATTTNVTDAIVTHNASYSHTITSDNATLWNLAISNVNEGVSTNLAGILSGNGTAVILPANNTALVGTQESFTTALKNAYDWLVTNITSAWKTSVDNFISTITAWKTTVDNFMASSDPSLLVPKTTTVSGHALSANVTISASDVGLGSVTNDAQITKAIGTTKGDIIAYTASNSPSRLGIGADGTVLTAASGQATGLQWVAPSSGSSDVVFVATPANFAINSTTDVTIVTRDVANVAATNQLIVDADFLIMNNSTATRVYVITTDFDAAFDVEHSTGASAYSTTLWHPFHIHAVLDVQSASLAYATFTTEGQLAAGIASGGDTTMLATHLRAMGWGTTASNLTGTVTVVLKVRSAAVTATQTLYLQSLIIRKETPS